MKAALLFFCHSRLLSIFLCRVWLLTSSPCALGLPGNSALVHEYCAPARSSSLVHELFMNTYVVGHGYYYIDNNNDNNNNNSNVNLIINGLKILAEAWEYIQSTRDMVCDLERRVRLSKCNVDAMNLVMAGWCKDPLYKRKGDKKDSLLNIEVRNNGTYV